MMCLCFWIELDFVEWNVKDAYLDLVGDELLQFHLSFNLVVNVSFYLLQVLHQYNFNLVFFPVRLITVVA